MKNTFKFMAVVLTASMISFVGISPAPASEGQGVSVAQEAAARSVELLSKVAERAVEQVRLAPTAANAARAGSAYAALELAKEALKAFEVTPQEAAARSVELLSKVAERAVEQVRLAPTAANAARAGSAYAALDLAKEALKAFEVTPGQV